MNVSGNCPVRRFTSASCPDVSSYELGGPKSPLRSGRTRAESHALFCEKPPFVLCRIFHYQDADGHGPDVRRVQPIGDIARSIVARSTAKKVAPNPGDMGPTGAPFGMPISNCTRSAPPVVHQQRKSITSFAFGTRHTAGWIQRIFNRCAGYTIGTDTLLRRNGASKRRADGRFNGPINAANSTHIRHRSAIAAFNLTKREAHRGQNYRRLSQGTRPDFHETFPFLKRRGN